MTINFLTTPKFFSQIFHPNVNNLGFSALQWKNSLCNCASASVAGARRVRFLGCTQFAWGFFCCCCWGFFFWAYETMVFLFVKSCSTKGGCIQGLGEHVLTVSHKDTKCFRTFLFLLFLCDRRRHMRSQSFG
jgi:hypothetical protein